MFLKTVWVWTRYENVSKQKSFNVATDPSSNSSIITKSLAGKFNYLYKKMKWKITINITKHFIT